MPDCREDEDSTDTYRRGREGVRVVLHDPWTGNRKQKVRRVTCLLRGMLLANFWTASCPLKSLFFGEQQSRQMTAVAVRMMMMKNPRQ